MNDNLYVNKTWPILTLFSLQGWVCSVIFCFFLYDIFNCRIQKTIQKQNFVKIYEHLKSVNLHYITLGFLDDGTNKSSTKSLMFQLLLFYAFYRLRALKTLYFYFCNFIKKNKKINWKDFCKEFCKKSWKRNNT